MSNLMVPFKVKIKPWERVLKEAPIGSLIKYTATARDEADSKDFCNAGGERIVVGITGACLITETTHGPIEYIPMIFCEFVGVGEKLEKNEEAIILRALLLRWSVSYQNLIDSLPPETRPHEIKDNLLEVYKDTTKVL